MLSLRKIILIIFSFVLSLQSWTWVNLHEHTGDVVTPWMYRALLENREIQILRGDKHVLRGRSAIRALSSGEAGLHVRLAPEKPLIKGVKPININIDLTVDNGKFKSKIHSAVNDYFTQFLVWRNPAADNEIQIKTEAKRELRKALQGLKEKGSLPIDEYWEEAKKILRSDENIPVSIRNALPDHITSLTSYGWLPEDLPDGFRRADLFNFQSQFRTEFERELFRDEIEGVTSMTASQLELKPAEKALVEASDQYKRALKMHQMLYGAGSMDEIASGGVLSQPVASITTGTELLRSPAYSLALQEINNRGSDVQTMIRVSRGSLSTIADMVQLLEPPVSQDILAILRAPDQPSSRQIKRGIDSIEQLISKYNVTNPGTSASEEISKAIEKIKGLIPNFAGFDIVPSAKEWTDGRQGGASVTEETLKLLMDVSRENELQLRVHAFEGESLNTEFYKNFKSAIQNSEGTKPLKLRLGHVGSVDLTKIPESSLVTPDTKTISTIEERTFAFIDILEEAKKKGFIVSIDVNPRTYQVLGSGEAKSGAVKTAKTAEETLKVLAKNIQILHDKYQYVNINLGSDSLGKYAGYSDDLAQGGSTATFSRNIRELFSQKDESGEFILVKKNLKKLLEDQLTASTKRAVTSIKGTGWSIARRTKLLTQIFRKKGRRGYHLRGKDNKPLEHIYFKKNDLLKYIPQVCSR
jgi:hypothetical protein